MLANPPKRTVTTLRTTAPTSMGEYMDRVFETFRNEMLTGLLPRGALWEFGPEGRWMNALTDVEDRGGSYEVRADLPGVRKEDIDLRIQGRCLTIEAKETASKEEKGKNFVSRERSYEGFCRTLDLPEDVIGEKISARYENGVLTLNLPKSHPEPEKKIPVS